MILMKEITQRITNITEIKSAFTSLEFTETITFGDDHMLEKSNEKKSGGK